MKPTAKFRIEGEDATAAAFRSALGTAQSTANRMSSAFKAAFAGISVAAIAGVAMRSIELGDTLQKMSVKAGIGGKAISELAHAAKMADVDMSGLSNALRFMQKAVNEAGTGSKPAQLAFRALGIELKDIRGLAADKQFELIADRISQLKDPTDKSRAATELFGRAGADLLPMFEQGAEGIRKAREEAEKLGLSFSDEQLQKLADADDAIKRLQSSWDGFATTLVAKVAPAISATLDLLSGQGRVQESNASLISGIELAISRLEQPNKYPLSDSQIADRQRRLEKLRAKLSEIRNAELNRTIPSGAPAPTLPGFASADAETEANEKALKAKEALAKEEAAIRLRYAEQERQDYLRVQESLQSDVEDVLREGASRNEQVLDFTVENIVTEVGYSMEKVKDEMTVFSEQAARNMQTAFADFLFDPFSDGLKGMLKGFIDVIRRMVAEVAAAKIFGSMGGVEGVGNFISGLIPGFATGGSFKVGGSGGTDSQLVAFKATPGEMVDIRTPGQGRGGVVFAPVYHIDARGSTPGTAAALSAELNRRDARLKADLVNLIRGGAFA